MKFNKHLFISYTHADNEKLTNQEAGWVTRFHETLEKCLYIRLGEKPGIWRDDKLSGNDIFSEEILAQLPDVALLVSVLSERYLKSDWCLREANAFCQAAERAGGLHVDRKSRVFKVLKLPVRSLVGLPDEYTRALGFSFYKSKDNVPVEIDPAYGGDMVGDFNLGVAILAQKLADTIESLRVAAPSDAPPIESKGTVFLAETSWDLERERSLLEAELSGRGYKVLPDRDLPSHEEQCYAEVKKILAASSLVVQLIGNHPGMVPNGPSQRMIDEVQNEMAASESVARGVRRLIWMQDTGQGTNSAHRQFVERLNRDDRMQSGADLVAGDFEAFKNAVLAALHKLQTAKSAAPQPDATPAERGKLIYIICDKRDSKTTVDLRKALRARGFDPQRPLFEGDASTVRQQNDAMLRDCAIALLYYGAGDEAWYRSNMVELEKAKLRAPVWTYLAAPVTSHKEELRDEFEGGSMIDGMAGATSEADLDRMLAVAGAQRS
jgi:hypothetical protein